MLQAVFIYKHFLLLMFAHIFFVILFDLLSSYSQRPTGKSSEIYKRVNKGNDNGSLWGSWTSCRQEKYIDLYACNYINKPNSWKVCVFCSVWMSKWVSECVYVWAWVRTKVRMSSHQEWITNIDIHFNIKVMIINNINTKLLQLPHWIKHLI